jgi:hypothetical protein
MPIGYAESLMRIFVLCKLPSLLQLTFLFGPSGIVSCIVLILLNYFVYFTFAIVYFYFPNCSHLDLAHIEVKKYKSKTGANVIKHFTAVIYEFS